MIKSWIPPWTIPVVLVLSVGTVWLRLSIVKTTYQVNQVDQRIRDLSREREQAELRFAALRSPRKLENLARSKFNLAQPRADQVVYVK